MIVVIVGLVAEPAVSCLAVRVNQHTNKLQFCISWHAMEEATREEYRASIVQTIFPLPAFKVCKRQLAHHGRIC
jgi:nitrate/TMAO reductase-like tetraheme cytochrome c subunit